MKVYRVEGIGTSSGGFAIVAAETAEKSAEIANSMANKNGDVKFEAKQAFEMTSVKPVSEMPSVLAFYEWSEPAPWRGEL